MPGLSLVLKVLTSPGIKLMTNANCLMRYAYQAYVAHAIY